MRGSNLLLSLVLVVSTTACKGPTDPEMTNARDCWGTGAEGEDCAEQVSDRASTLGIAPAPPLNAAGDCGDLVACGGKALTEVVREQGTDSGLALADPGSSATRRETATSEPVPQVREIATPAVVPLAEHTEAPAADRPPTCGGIDLRAVAQRGTPFSSEELSCLRDVALDLEPLEVDDFTDMQMATIGLVNARDGRWQKAVERSLSYSELRNSPTLNFAGITPAYNDGRYAAVLDRADSVWANLDKGYRLSARDRTFVAEYACRAGVQLHMEGQLSPRHERWCRIWVDRLEHEGGDATEARSLLQQVE